MSKLKRNLFLLVAALLTAKAVYAAVVPIVDTKASSSWGASYLSSSEDSGHTSTYSGVECGEKTASSPEGCNILLGINNAVATLCDGGKYTCTFPLEPVPGSLADDELCGYLVAGDAIYSALSGASINDCKSKLGDGASFRDCGSNGKWCYCEPGVYSQECLVAGVRGSGPSCNGKYQTCITLYKCSALSAGVYAEVKASKTACETELGKGFIIGQECVSDDGSKEQYYCQYKGCNTITGVTFAASESEKNQLIIRDGKVSGVCWNTDTSAKNTIIVCNDNYSADASDNTSCSGNQTPKVCNLEGTPKYHKTQCECSDDLYPYTSANCTEEGYALAGTPCSSGGTEKYPYCLPKCDKTGNKQVVDLTGVCAPKGGTIFEQTRWMCNIGDQSANTSGCNSANVTHCCIGSGMTCYDQYMPVNESSVYCTPLGKDVDTKNLCSDASTVKWQCGCPSSYQTEEECQAKLGDVEGKVCSFDGVDKYETCAIHEPCPSEQDNTITTQQENCQEGKVTKCRYALSGDTTEIRFLCQCPSGKSRMEYCEEKAGITPADGISKSSRETSCNANSVCAQCLKEYFGKGQGCDFEAKENGKILPNFIKYTEGFEKIISCESAKEEMGDITLINEDEKCTLNDRITETPFTLCTYALAPEKRYKICQCPNNFKTIDALCSERAASDDISIAECKANYFGTAPLCSYDTDAITKKPVIKYSGLSYACPINKELVDTQESCQIDGSDYAGQPKACVDATGKQKYYCSCPTTFGTECGTAGEIRGGTACRFDNATTPSYEKCLPQCDESTGKLAVSNIDGCPYIDGVEAEPSGECFKSQGAPTVSYQCGCPRGQGYKTLDDFCGENGVEYAGRTFTKEECLNNFVGQGSVCTYEGDRKYKKFVLVCPKDRPLYYTPENCSENGIKGTVDYVCQDRDEPALEKIVCKCPSSWLLPSGQNASNGTSVCDANQEASGKICDFEGYKNIKYEKCYPLCDKLATNGQGIHYLEDDKAYEYDCRNLLGEGATFGANNDGGKCSKNHVLFSPCYCGEDYKETCANDENKRPAENVSTCTINGTTYYNNCQFNECVKESSTIAIVDLAAGETVDGKCKALYGSGATGRACGNNQAECSCDPRTYTETCDYPFTKPTDASYCKYGEGSTLMKNGTEHYKLGECKVRPLLALCGKHILKSDGTPDTTPIIYVTETEAQCKGRYGNGAQTQLCEYEENTNKRAFNCYFRLSDFPYTEDNCPVRHVLGKEYITINGKPHYKSCDCHSAYQYHKYNCAGMLSGGACSQKVTSAMLSADKTLREANVSVGTEIAQYPYCQCTTDYNQTCDGERYIGVGTPCNGKYTACECKKDELPENWADNYYGCPGGKKPTGVTKPNGCGGKYYQCSVTSCTWQHTETCKAPLIGVDGCQDNQGNIGGYKSCRCPDGYKTCQNGMAGKGDPCILNGEYYYTACEDKTACVHGETMTCQQEFLVGVNPCTRNDVTYFEYCKCSAGFDKLCENGEVGVGPACKLNGKEYYQSCTKPTMACTSEHKNQCDVMQEKYDPCVNSNNQLMYKCKCPSNWTTCEGNMGATGADTCVDSSGTRYFSQCPISESCTPMQEKTYKVCTAAQKGAGNSCVASDGATKYAECEDTTACRSNGYQFTCLGFDATALGNDFCVDGNGNKLYKECKCPTNWITCPGKNNTKGRSCIALNEQGVSQEAVFESCSCDASLYKYTCEADETGNTGVIPSKANSCTPATYKDGRREEGTTLYQACSCSPSFKYNCRGNGHVIDEGQNYCEQIIGGTKLYEYCACDSKFGLQSCSENGQVPPTNSSAICTPANPDAIYQEKGIKTLYSECGCSNEYGYTCTEGGQTPDGEGCTNTDGTTRYKACLCDASYLSCAPSGQNKGIRGVTEDEGGKICKPTKGNMLYETCKCESSYNKICDFSIESEPNRIYYTNIGTDYCDLGDGTRRYKSCVCPSRYNKTCSGDDIPPTGQYCVNEAGEKLYEACLCTAKGIAGYKELLIGSVHIKSDQFDDIRTEFESLVKTNCGFADNYEVEADECGYAYWKCANNDLLGKTLYSSVSEACQKQTPSDSGVAYIVQESQEYSFTTKEFSASKGTKTYYEATCDCPPAYSEPEDCSKALLEIGRCVYDGANEAYQKVPCSAIEYNGQKALIPTGSYCINRSGEKKYQYCQCNRAIFVYTRSGSSGSCLCPGVDNKLNHSVWACQDNYTGASCPSKCSEKSVTACWYSSNKDSGSCTGS